MDETCGRPSMGERMCVWGGWVEGGGGAAHVHLRVDIQRSRLIISHDAASKVKVLRHSCIRICQQICSIIPKTHLPHLCCYQEKHIRFQQIGYWAGTTELAIL